MTTLAPAASALTMSPEYLIPPSAMTGTPYFLATCATSYTAVICGTPMPATIRVVQIEPGPMPTLTASAPAAISASAASAVAMFPAMTGTFGNSALTIFRVLMMFLLWPCAESRTSTSACASTSAWARSSTFAVTPMLRRRADDPFVTGGVGELDSLFDVLDGDESLEVAVFVYQRQLLDLVLAQDCLCLFHRSANRRSDQIVLGHDLGDRAVIVGEETHVTVGDDAHQLAHAVHNGNAGDLVLSHEFVGIRDR